MLPTLLLKQFAVVALAALCGQPNYVALILPPVRDETEVPDEPGE